MKIVAVDPFYLKMPDVTDAADGTQDSFLVRVRTDEGLEGWGESDASPLVSMSAYFCPMSHGNIINIRESLLGERLDGPEDVARLHAKALRNGLDIGQIHHAYSAADIALWDVVGKKLGVPVYGLWSSRPAAPKLPYASVLFGETPEATYEIAAGLAARGFTAAKFGWGPLGKKDVEYDQALVRAAREGMGSKAEVMVDAGWVWARNAVEALRRAEKLAKFRVTWLEEPLLPDAIREYAEIRRGKPAIPIAAGENSATFRQAEDYIENAGLDFIQIDVGRIGGVTVAREVMRLASRRGVQYVNHTFKSKLSVAASIHVFADIEAFRYLEYPAAGSPLSETLVSGVLDRDGKGHVWAPDGPGLGVKVNLDVVRQYGTPVRLEVGGRPVGESGAP